MKKLLLSAALFAVTLSASFAQITLPAFQTPSMTGGAPIPVFQGMAGSMSVQGSAIPKVTGTFNSAAVNATLTASTLETYANDLTILVTTNPTPAAAADVLLQIGGFSNFSTNKIAWGCEPACDSETIGTLVSGNVNFTGLDFTNSTYVIWLVNGWANGQNGNPSTNTGEWSVTSMTFGGIALGNVSIESNAPVSSVAYPNPASDVLNIAVEGEEVVSVAVIAMDGKVVSTTEGSTALVADLTAGMYIYEARTASGAVIRNTFVKK
jgi:hypothetical protein